MRSAAPTSELAANAGMPDASAPTATHGIGAATDPPSRPYHRRLLATAQSAFQLKHRPHPRPHCRNCLTAPTGHVQPVPPGLRPTLLPTPVPPSLHGRDLRLPCPQRPHLCPSRTRREHGLRKRHATPHPQEPSSQLRPHQATHLSAMIPRTPLCQHQHRRHQRSHCVPTPHPPMPPRPNHRQSPHQPLTRPTSTRSSPQSSATRSTATTAAT